MADDLTNSDVYEALKDGGIPSITKVVVTTNYIRVFQEGNHDAVQAICNILKVEGFWDFDGDVETEDAGAVYNTHTNTTMTTLIRQEGRRKLKEISKTPRPH